MSDSPLIEAKSLCLKYGELDALREVDLEIKPGIVGLLGPNGAGKSTFLKLILGLLQPTSGDIRVLGMNPSERPLEVRALIGYMPEGDHVLPHLNALQYAEMSAQLSGLRRADATSRAHDILHLVGLGEARYRKLGSFSTGMKQRARLAAALSGSPKLLLLDEPTSGLDPASRDDILELIETLPKKSNTNIMLSTHILSDVEKVCQDIVMIFEGEARYHGPIQGLLETDSQLYEVRVKSNPEKLKKRLDREGILAKDARNALHVPLPNGMDLRELFRFGSEAGVQIRHAAPLKRSMADAFLEVADTAHESEHAPVTDN